MGVSGTNNSEKPGTSSEKPSTSSEKPGTSSEKPSTSSEDPIAEGVNMDMLIDVPGTPEILPYAFYPGRPPATRQMIYQLCDIRCAEAQKLVSANDGQVRRRA